jgi:hypothetical protein
MACELHCHGRSGRSILWLRCVSVSHCFIAQVINIIECQEFCSLLLLLQSDLQDSMIPHQTKLHQLILEAWSHSFKALKCDLAVTPSS